MQDAMLRTAVTIKALQQWVVANTVDSWRDERGEGVISVAIAVLIMAALGALVWVGFQTFWSGTESRTQSQLDQIGG